LREAVVRSDETNSFSGSRQIVTETEKSTVETPSRQQLACIIQEGLAI
jgi:hypothetical protein